MRAVYLLLYLGTKADYIDAVYETEAEAEHIRSLKDIPHDFEVRGYRVRNVKMRSK